MFALKVLTDANQSLMLVFEAVVHNGNTRRSRVGNTITPAGMIASPSIIAYLYGTGPAEPGADQFRSAANSRAHVVLHVPSEQSERGTSAPPLRCDQASACGT